MFRFSECFVNHFYQGGAECLPGVFLAELFRVSIFCVESAPGGIGEAFRANAVFPAEQGINLSDEIAVAYAGLLYARAKKPVACRVIFVSSRNTAV